MRTVPAATVPNLRPRRGFSLIEMLVALSISATLLTAALTALDTSFRGYKYITQSASTHVVARIVTHRLMGMVRTGSNFAPYPTDPLDKSTNPVIATWIEFQGDHPAIAGNTQIIKIERRDAAPGADALYELWYTQTEYSPSGAQVSTDSKLLLSGVTNAQFTLEYDVGPRLTRATMDITIMPNDNKSIQLGTDLSAPPIRFVASATPRRLEPEE